MKPIMQIELKSFELSVSIIRWMKYSLSHFPNSFGASHMLWENFFQKLLEIFAVNYAREIENLKYTLLSFTSKQKVYVLWHWDFLIQSVIIRINSFQINNSLRNFFPAICFIVLIMVKFSIAHIDNNHKYLSLTHICELLRFFFYWFHFHATCAQYFNVDIILYFTDHFYLIQLFQLIKDSNWLSLNNLTT